MLYYLNLGDNFREFPWISVNFCAFLNSSKSNNKLPPECTSSKYVGHVAHAGRAWRALSLPWRDGRALIWRTCFDLLDVVDMVWHGLTCFDVFRHVWRALMCSNMFRRVLFDVFDVLAVLWRAQRVLMFDVTGFQPPPFIKGGVSNFCPIFEGGTLATYSEKGGPRT